VRRASLFEDVVVRCIRYAFANIPPGIGRVFFAKEVALPFLWFRLLRHGYLGSPIHWREHQEVIPSLRTQFDSHTDCLPRTNSAASGWLKIQKKNRTLFFITPTVRNANMLVYPS
jgi:hypothetical protein